MAKMNFRRLGHRKPVRREEQQFMLLVVWKKRIYDERSRDYEGYGRTGKYNFRADEDKCYAYDEPATNQQILQMLKKCNEFVYSDLFKDRRDGKKTCLGFKIAVYKLVNREYLVWERIIGMSRAFFNEDIGRYKSVYKVKEIFPYRILKS
jgi:hypothetical protein